MTYRELINEVLIRLREDTIATDWSGAINDSANISIIFLIFLYLKDFV